MHMFYMYIYVYTDVYACMYVCMHIYIYTCRYAQTFAYACTYVGMHVDMYACIHADQHARTSRTVCKFQHVAEGFHRHVSKFRMIVEWGYRVFSHLVRGVTWIMFPSRVSTAAPPPSSWTNPPKHGAKQAQHKMKSNFGVWIANQFLYVRYVGISFH